MSSCQCRSSEFEALASDALSSVLASQASSAYSCFFLDISRIWLSLLFLQKLLDLQKFLLSKHNLMLLSLWESDIVVEEFVNHVGNNQNFDCSTGPEQMMDKDIHNEHHSHMIRKNTSGTRAVEGNRNNLEYCRNNSDKDNIVDKLRP
ncbi:hypothetical protein Tco_1209359 [Tanacetum coccineum]